MPLINEADLATTNFISLHLLSEPPIKEVVKQVERLRPRAIKTLGSPDYLLNLIKALDGVLDYTPYYIYRAWGDDDVIGTPDTFGGLRLVATTEDGSIKYFNPGTAWTYWADRGISRWRLETLSRATKPVHVEFLNECFPDLREEEGRTISDLYSFEREATARLGDDYNLRACAVNVGVGRSTPDMWRAMGDFTGGGLFGRLRQYEGIIGVHAYSGLFMGLWHLDAQAEDPENHKWGLRKPPIEYVKTRRIGEVAEVQQGSYLAFRPIYDMQWIHYFGGGGIPVVIGEFGFDNAGAGTYKLYTGGADLAGWRQQTKYWEQMGFLDDGKTPEQFYAEELKYAQDQYAKEPQVVAATIFSYGLWDTPFNPEHGKSFDIREPDGTAPVIDEFLNLLEPDEPDEPGEPGEPGDDKPSFWERVIAWIKDVLERLFSRFLR